MEEVGDGVLGIGIGKTESGRIVYYYLGIESGVIRSNGIIRHHLGVGICTQLKSYGTFLLTAPIPRHKGRKGN